MKRMLYSIVALALVLSATPSFGLGQRNILPRIKSYIPVLRRIGPPVMRDFPPIEYEVAPPVFEPTPAPAPAPSKDPKPITEPEQDVTHHPDSIVVWAGTEAPVVR